MIEIDRLTKRFGEKTAVSELSRTVRRGELLAFLGPNGAGKTNEGTVRVCGCDVLKDPVAAKTHLSYVPDQPYLYDKLTGREFLTFVARMYRLDSEAARRKITHIADTLALHDFLDHLTEEYSHGMKQRTVIAAALIHDPDVIVVDEPMVGLDPRSARVVKDMLRGLSQNGATVFMSTHSLDVAEELANRIGIIHRGKLIALGTLEELRRVSGSAHGLEESFLRLTGEEEEA